MRSRATRANEADQIEAEAVTEGEGATGAEEGVVVVEVGTTLGKDVVMRRLGEGGQEAVMETMEGTTRANIKPRSRNRVRQMLITFPLSRTTRKRNPR